MSSARLSFYEVAEVAWAAGFRGYSDTGHLTVALAVCEAESRRYPDALGPNKDGSFDRGLWQFNSVQHAEVTDAQAFDPAAAAKALYVVSMGGATWSPWVGYTSGAYLAYVPFAALAARKISTLPQWAPLAKFDREWSLKQDHWVYRKHIDQAVEIPVALPTVSSGVAGAGRKWDWGLNAWTAVVDGQIVKVWSATAANPVGGTWISL